MSYETFIDISKWYIDKRKCPNNKLVHAFICKLDGQLKMDEF